MVGPEEIDEELEEEVTTECEGFGLVDRVIIYQVSTCTLPGEGEFHDQGDAKWIVIRGRLRGHNDTPFGRPTPRAYLVVSVTIN
jgi:hypothetical protein